MVSFKICHHSSSERQTQESEGGKQVTVKRTPEEEAFIRHARQQEGDIIEPEGLCVIKLVETYEATNY